MLTLSKKSVSMALSAMMALSLTAGYAMAEDHPVTQLTDLVNKLTTKNQTQHAAAPQQTATPQQMAVAQPGPEHQFLQHFVGEWDTTIQSTEMPGKPSEVSKGTESVKSLGGFWIVSETKATMMNQPFTGTSTLGFDDQKNKYVGTWIDSMNGHLWEYEGNLDETGKVLTMTTEGPCPMQGNEIKQFKEVVKITGPNTRQFTYQMLGDNGQWKTVMNIDYQRKQ